MDEAQLPELEAEVVERTAQTHLRRFQEADASCRGLQLPDGLLLRFNLADALFFYLRSGVADGKIFTRVFASDSPYDREKSFIGQVSTPMFEEMADSRHFQEVEKLVREWVEFVTTAPDPARPFTTFAMGTRQPD